MWKSSSRNAHSGYVGAGSRWNGVVNAPGPFEVNGAFEGELHCEDEVSVGRAGDFQGKVFARRVVVAGIVRGEIEAAEVEVRAGGRLPDVLVRTASLSLDPEGDAQGARFQVSPGALRKDEGASS